MSEAPNAEEAFAAVTKSLIGQEKISTGRMFGAGALKVSGRVFALLVREQLVVKLPAARVDALVASGEGERFDPGHGRLMKEWVAIAPAAELDWLAVADEARQFVGDGRQRGS